MTNVIQLAPYAARRAVAAELDRIEREQGIEARNAAVARLLEELGSDATA